MICPRSQRRRGYVLIYFGMIVFALMAIAALAIDVGFVLVCAKPMERPRTARRSEGLRFRDGVPPQWIDQSATANPLGLDSTIVMAMQKAGLDPSSLDNVRRGPPSRTSSTPSTTTSIRATLLDQPGPAPWIDFRSPYIPASGQTIAAAQTIGKPGSTLPGVYNPSPIRPGNSRSTRIRAGGDMVRGNYSNPFKPPICPAPADAFPVAR